MSGRIDVRGRASTICMYTPTSDGGHARYTWELMTALARQEQPQPDRELSFELVTSRDLDPRYRSAQYPVHAILPPLPKRDTFGTQAGWALNRLTHYPRRERQLLAWLRGRPDVTGVHFQEWTPWLAAPLIRAIRGMGKRVFYTVHNVVAHRRPPLVPRWLMRRWVRSACRACDGLFVHTDHLAEQLARSLGPSHPPIYVVPHGVWTVQPRPDGPTLLERLAWKRLLFFGVVRRNKGLDLLLRALAQLPDYSLTIAGETHEPQYVRSVIEPLVAERRRAGARIEVIDRFVPEEDVPALLARHSVAVMPYTPEFVAQSGAVFMALAHELPVVASEAGGLRELFATFPIGATFRGHTPAALAAAVRLLETADADGLGAAIRAAQRRFAWDDAAQATIAGYAAAMGPAIQKAISVQTTQTTQTLTQTTTSDDRALHTIPVH